MGADERPMALAIERAAIRLRNGGDHCEKDAPVRHPQADAFQGPEINA